MELDARRAVRDDEASRRYYSRQAEIEEHEAELGASPSSRARPELDEEVRSGNRRDFLNPRDMLGLERIIGTSDLLAINYLGLAARAARAVCRIRVRDLQGGLEGYGTGFLVASGLLLTNNHVLPTAAIAQQSLAEFDVEDDLNFLPKPIQTFALLPQQIFCTDQQRDFTFVAVADKAINSTPLSSYGVLPLRRASGKALVGEPVTIIQHPEGGPKRIALRDNRIVNVIDDFIQYEADTDPGASGSPVNSDQFEVVALHHAGVPKKDAGGRVLTKDDQVFNPLLMSEDRIEWVANEGIRISAIFAALEQAAQVAGPEAVMPRRVLEALDPQAAPPVATTTDVLSPARSRKAQAELGREATTKAEKLLKELQSRTGYDPGFLTGFPIPWPGVSQALKPELAKRLDNGGTRLDYLHFSLMLSATRRFAVVTGVNIDGAHQGGDTQEVWRYDPRLDPAAQVGPELYGSNILDRGHLVRRIDPAWGSAAEALQGTRDTFFWTNSTPQHHKFNDQWWGDIEDYVLYNAQKEKQRITVFSGPVFRADDMQYRGIQIPADFWKIVCYLNADKRPAVIAFLRSQRNLLPEVELYEDGQFRTWQVQVTLLEKLTGVNWKALRKYDTFQPAPDKFAALVPTKESLKAQLT
jgi:endonuclease G